MILNALWHEPMKYWKFIICEGLLWSHKCCEWDWNWKVLWCKYHKTPFSIHSGPQFNKLHSISAAFILIHKRCQAHVGGIIMVSQMPRQSFVSLIMNITAHLQEHCIWSHMFSCELRQVPGLVVLPSVAFTCDDCVCIYCPRLKRTNAHVIFISQPPA